MTQKEFDELREGDIVRGRLSSDAYIVHARDKYRMPDGDLIIYTIVRTRTMSRPDEWDLVFKVPRNKA